METYNGYSNDEEVNAVINRVIQRMNGGSTLNDQRRNKDESLLAFAMKGADILENEYTERLNSVFD